MSTSVNGTQPKQWDVVPYLTSAPAGAVGLVAVFRDYMVKSRQQLGEAVPNFPRKLVFEEGCKAAGPFGAVICMQMAVKGVVQPKDPKERNFGTLVGSSAVAGAVSSPFVAMVNGKSMNWTYSKSWQRFTFPVAAAITVQETCFVAGVTAQELLAPEMKKRFGDNWMVDTVTAFVGGGVGGFAGHWANTAVTRWQNDLKVERHQLLWGAARRVRAVAVLSVIFNWVEKALKSVVE